MPSKSVSNPPTPRRCSEFTCGPLQVFKIYFPPSANLQNTALARYLGARSVVRCVVAGMLPHKLHRGKEAMDRMKCFEGIPAPYDRQKRMVVPAALKVLRLKPLRRVRASVEFVS